LLRQIIKAFPFSELFMEQHGQIEQLHRWWWWWSWWQWDEDDNF